MATVDPYRLLQVHPEADAEIIQVAYRKLAQRHHPDVASGPEAARRMAELNAARDLLLDPVARAAYDREHAAGDRGRAGWGQAGSTAAATSQAPGPAAPERTGEAHRGAAGPPPGNPAGSVLTFGRYAGWSLGEIARRDVEYVEWLDRMPIGRTYRAEIDALLRGSRRRGGAGKAEEPHGLFRRR